jgi:hypothetical protein
MVDMTNLTNLTNLQGMAYYTNNMVDGILFSGGLIAFFFILMLVLIKQGNTDWASILAVSSWSMFLVSAFFWYAELVSVIFPLGFLILGAFSIIVLYTSSGRGY